MDDSKRKLIWHGCFLFLLGLLVGFVEQEFANPRMGLAAHLEGVMNGTFLIALGSVWLEVRLAPGMKRAVYWTVLYGAYVNWACCSTCPLTAAPDFHAYCCGLSWRAWVAPSTTARTMTTPLCRWRVPGKTLTAHGRSLLT